MKSEKNAAARHFSLISPHIRNRLSQTRAVYPRNLAGWAARLTFALRNVQQK
jgi:hypothetical protein